MTDAVFPEFSSAKRACVLSSAGLSYGELIFFTSLQGVTARKKPVLFLDHVENGKENSVRLLEMSVPDGYDHQRIKSVWSAAVRFSDAVKDRGYILIDYKNAPRTINTAATLATQGYVIADVTVADKLSAYGYKQAVDLTAAGAPGIREVFYALKHRLNKKLLIHQDPGMLQLRDYGIAANALCFYTDESDSGRAFRDEVFAWADANAPVLGWSGDELKFIESASVRGKFVIPADWAGNLSFFAGMKAGASFSPAYKERAVKPERGKHYVCLVVSDGDNIQWMLRDFTLDSVFSPSKRKDLSFPLTHTVSPSLSALAPSVMRCIYAAAGENDSFISGVSGHGYINALSYPEEFLDGFTKTAAGLMKNSGLDIVTLLDNNKLNSDEAASRALSFYSRFDNIRGGIWELDPGRYEDGKGKVFWSGGKPFVSVRVSLWRDEHCSGTPVLEWLDGRAEEINSFGCDPGVIDGYTVVNIHPWSMTPEYTEYFVSKLAPHVEIVSAGEMIEMLKKNVRHTNAAPAIR